jgi:hypothetical protein
VNTLADFVAPKPRFGRSANVERDRGAHAVDGYVPTGRAIDVVKRVAEGLLDARLGRTFSITGPHGGGKSSLAVFIAALLSADTAPEYKVSIALLRSADKDAARLVTKARKHCGIEKTGFVSATAAARNESVTKTISRAISIGASQAFGQHQAIVELRATQSEADVLQGLQAICAERPTLLIIDEFGKNLEAYARAKGDGDPYLLQEIAEATQGRSPMPLIVITMQHLAFDEYVQETSASRRREWAKVQGRFQDIPYVETAEQSRRLIVESLDQSNELRAAATSYVAQHADIMNRLNLRGVVEDAVAAIPLHPVTLAVLPDLCSRYGQNERTLFSFVAGPEPLALPRVLDEINWHPEADLKLIGVDRVYDYFVESSSSALGVSAGASRWLEIEMRIRDTPGLSATELRALKTIGLLNLVSTGGKVRASREMLEFALLTGEEGSQDERSVGEVLDSLVGSGLIAHRTFSDEYRIWQGSDYDLKRAINSARRQVASQPLAELLRNAADLQPVVAGRHSQRSGVLRIFGQEFASSLDKITMDKSWDGLVLYWTGEAQPPSVINRDDDDGRPLVVVESGELEAVKELVIEAAALKLALESAREEDADWVAVRELAERSSSAQQQLLTAISEAWLLDARWTVVGTGQSLEANAGLSSALSTVADLAYPSTPQIRNEMIARRELTSQGAKARRMLIDAMIESPTVEVFGIDGYGPERAMYEALFRWTGLHRQRSVDGWWTLGVPKDKSWLALWTDLNVALDGADERRVPLDEAIAVATKPPYGLKDGVLPLLAVAILLARRDDVALYEHGSLVLEIDDAVAERLAKNPFHFAVRNSATQGKARSAVIRALAERMKIRGHGTVEPTFLNVTTALFRELRVLPPFTQKTKTSLSEDAQAFRDAFHTAVEPDVLLFETLPAIFDMAPFRPRGRASAKLSAEFANQVAATILELRSCYDELLMAVATRLAEETSMPATLSELHARLRPRAIELDGRVLEARLKGFVGALARDLEPKAWLENVAMVASEGQAPRVWTDDVADRFPLRVAELGGAMRRTEALLYDNRAREHEPGGFTATRVTLTHADGSEWNELVAITDEDRAHVDPRFDEIIAGLTEAFGSRAAACRILMARLAIDGLEDSQQDASTRRPRSVSNDG